MTRIVIGYDGAQGGRDAIALGRALAADVPDTELVVATVYPHAPAAPAAGKDPDVQALLRERGQETLDGARELLADVPRAGFRLALGSSPGAGLHELARELDPDVLVVGTSHRGALGRVSPGSVTEQTIHGAPCPIAVAPRDYANEPHALRRIGVGFDGSEESRHALLSAGRAAEARGASVVVIDAIDPVWPLAGVWGVTITAQELRETVEEQTRAARRALPTVADLTVQMPEGDPAGELVAASRELDLLVLGSRGYGPFKRLLLGSVSTHVVRGAECPVLLFPRGAQRADGEAVAVETRATAPSTASTGS